MHKARMRALNFAGYLADIGLLGAIDVVINRWRRTSLVSARVRGIRTRVWYRKGTTDFGLLRKTFRLRDCIPKALQTCTRILDLGANVGYTSLIYLNHYRGCELVAVEPEPRNVGMLRLNLQGYRNARILEGAMWPRCARLSIVNPQAPSVSFRVMEDANGPGLSVRSITPDDVFKALGGHPDVIKCDIEGTEREFLNSGFLRSCKVLVIELHERYSPGLLQAWYAFLDQAPHRVATNGEYVVVYWNS